MIDTCGFDVILSTRWLRKRVQVRSVGINICVSFCHILYVIPLCCTTPFFTPPPSLFLHLLLLGLHSLLLVLHLLLPYPPLFTPPPSFFHPSSLPLPPFFTPSSSFFLHTLSSRFTPLLFFTHPPFLHTPSLFRTPFFTIPSPSSAR